VARSRPPSVSNPEVAEVVIRREGRAGHKRMVAYMVGLPGVAEPTVADRRQCSWPNPARPIHGASAFVTLDPCRQPKRQSMDPQGPASPRPSLRDEGGYEAPRTTPKRGCGDLGRRATGWWRRGSRKTLRLGGDSILRHQVVSRARRPACALREKISSGPDHHRPRAGDHDHETGRTSRSPSWAPSAHADPALVLSGHAQGQHLTTLNQLPSV